ncbi:MAG: hypothetical protein OJF49_004545 [Ktedonobacterales bacterium]|jgi:RNA polymerase sigma factor (sigma-70 family)|nr:MAG: hypothetical protein OJF49_004545 [Ktedonobacterales bacterium]
MFQELVLTVPYPTPILVTTACRFPRVVAGTPRVARPITTGKKEFGMGDDHHEDAHAARRVQLDALFQQLPPPGSADYWLAIERKEGDLLPVEILVRCFRERLAAQAEAEANRIVTVIFSALTTEMSRWSRDIAHRSRSGQIPELAEELEQEGYTALLETLRNPLRQFFEVHFHTSLRRLEQHVAWDYMQKQGQWVRPGVDMPERIPKDMTQSLSSPRKSGDDDMPGTDPADTSTDDAYTNVEIAADLDALLAELTSEQQKLLALLFWDDLTQDDAARLLGVDSRTVRNRLKRIMAFLRARYRDEEGNNG